MATVWNQNPVQPWSNYNPYPNNPPIIPPVAADPKIANLQFQAQQWQQQKQFEEWMASQSKSTVDPEMEKKIKENEDELQIIQKEEEEFDKQYSDWEKQFDQWKEQNKNHPNKEQFKQYEEQWNTWKQQMNTKRQEISDKKTAILTTLNNLRVEQSKVASAAAATMNTMMVPPPPIVPPSLQPPQMPFPGQQQTPFPVTPQYGGYPGGTPAPTGGQMMIPPPGHNGPQPLAAPPPMFPPGGFQAPAPLSSSFSSSNFGTMTTTTTAVSYGNFGGNSYPNSSFQQGGGGGMYGAPPIGMTPFPGGPMGNPPNFGPTNQQIQHAPNSMNPPPPFYPGGGQMGIGGQSFPSPMQRGGGGIGPPQPSYQSSAQNSLQSQSSSIDSNSYHFNKGSDKSGSLPPLPNMAPWGSNNTNPFPLASHTMFNNNNNASFGPPPTSYNQQDMQANSGRNNMAPPSSSSFSAATKGGWDQGRGEQRNQDQYSSSNNGGWKLDSRDFNDDSSNNYKPNSWNQQQHQSDAGRTNNSGRSNASTQPFPKPGQAFSYNPNPIMTPPHNGPPPSSANTNKRAYDDDKSNNANNNTKKRSGQSRWESSNTPSKPNNINVQNMNNQQFGNKGENSNNDLKHSIIGDTNNNLNQNMNETKGENQQHGMMTSFNGPPPAQASGGPPMDPNLPLAAVRMMFMLRMRGLLAQATNAAAGGGTGPLKGGDPLRGPPPRGPPPPMMNRFARHPPPPLMPHSSGPPGGVGGAGMRRPMMRPPPPRMATPFGARPRHPYMHKGPMARGGFHGPRHHRGGGRMNGFGGVGRNNNENNSQNSNNNYERGNNPFYSGANENNSALMATGPSAATQDNNEYYEGNTDYSCNEIDQNSFNYNHEYEHGSYPLDNDNYEDFTPHLKDDIRHYDQDFYYDNQYSDQYRFENAIDESHHHSTPNFEVNDVINVLSTEPKLFIVLRGLSGSGKSHVSKIIKEIAISLNKDTPKIYSIDDYFMDENNSYVFEPELESTYEASLEKAISKALLSNMNKIIIMDSINAKLLSYEPLIALASRIGYKAYVCEMDNEDVSKCCEQNIHSKTYEEIQRSFDEWEIAPYHYPRLDVLSILNYKKNVDKLSTTPKTNSPSSCKPVEPVGMKDQVSNDSSSCSFTSSRWDNIEKETNLDKLDGMRMKKRSSAANSIEDYLKEPDMLEEIKHCDSNSNKKRVRWADIEEAKEQAKHRALGFVVGMTDWNKMVDDQQPHKALNKTKFI